MSRDIGDLCNQALHSMETQNFGWMRIELGDGIVLVIAREKSATVLDQFIAKTWPAKKHLTSGPSGRLEVTDTPPRETNSSNRPADNYQGGPDADRD